MAEKVKMYDKPLRITSKAAGFNRGGRAHPADEVTHPPGTFTETQAQQILDEAELTDAAGQKVGKLVVRELTDAEFKAHQAAEKAGAKEEAKQ